MTPQYNLLTEAQTEFNRAIWAGNLTYADEGKFDDLNTRDEFVAKQIALTIKKLQKYLIKTRPLQSNKRIIKKKKTIFDS